MTFQPVIPYGGMAGWAFLQRTQSAQQEAFDDNPVIQRDTEYFLKNIGKISTAEDLVNDRRLLSVALGPSVWMKTLTENISFARCWRAAP